MKLPVRSLLITVGWALFQGYFHFSALINEMRGIPPEWYFLILIEAVLASSLYEDVEQTLKYWIVSIIFSIIIVLTLLYVPILIGALDSQFAPLIIIGSLQPLSVAILIISSISLLGCFIGQVLRNKLL